MLIQHICINLRCILVNTKNSEFGLGYDVVMKPYKDISGKNYHDYCDNPFTFVQLLNLRCILVNTKNSEFALGYDVVMKWHKDISGKNYHDYCDNLFTFVQLLKDLLACKTYCNGTIWVNKKYLPDGICKPSWMMGGAYKSYQDGSSNFMATVWQDNRIVKLLSMNSNPRCVVYTDRRLGHNVIQVNQPQNIQLYNRYMNNKCKYSPYIHFREKIDFPQVGIEPTPLIVHVSALPVRPPGTISSLIVQQELYVNKPLVLHCRAPCGKSKYKQRHLLVKFSSLDLNMQ